MSTLEPVRSPILILDCGFTVFDTALGPFGVAWRDDTIVTLQLPEADRAATQARLVRRCRRAAEAEPPPAIAAVVDGIATLIDGSRPDCTHVRLDLAELGGFERSVYAEARAIRPGATASYGEIARRVGEPQAAQAVGRALGRNPFPILVPCHRVLAAGGRLGGFSAHGGAALKRKLLAIESRHARRADDLFSESAG